MRELLKRYTPFGLRRAARELVEEIGISWHHRLATRKARRYSGPDLKLNIGCGPHTKRGWVNIDLTAGADLRLDLREALPFVSGSASIIYSEHFFEHLERPDAVRFLSEARRVLRPGGVFSVGVPDTEWPLLAYARKEDEYFVLARDHWHPNWCNTRLHHLNYHFRQDRQHKYAYDFETLEKMLEEAGFCSIARRPFDPALDDIGREKGTLYVEAHTPDR